MKRQVLVQDGAAVAVGAAVEGVSPFFEGSSVIADINMIGLTGTAIIEGSDDGVTYSTLLSSGAVTTQTRAIRLEVVAKRFMRANVTVRSAGTVTMAVESAL